MICFTAKMTHTKETITRLSITQYNCFEFGRKLIRFFIAISLIIYGLYANQNMITPMICLVLGCALVANINLRARVRANRIIKEINGYYPKSEYVFHEKNFIDGKNSKPVSYKNLIKLVDDRKYLYLYINKDSAYMVDKDTVSGDGSTALKSFLATNTNLKWERPGSLILFSIKDLVQRNDHYEGPRLK